MQTQAAAPILTIDHVRILGRDETPDDHRDEPGELAGPYTGTLAEILAELHDAADVDLGSITWLRGSTLWVAPAPSTWVLLDDVTAHRGNVIKVGTRSEIAGHHAHMGRRRLDIARARWVGSEPPAIGSRVVRGGGEAW